MKGRKERKRQKKKERNKELNTKITATYRNKFIKKTTQIVNEQ